MKKPNPQDIFNEIIDDGSFKSPELPLTRDEYRNAEQMKAAAQQQSVFNRPRVRLDIPPGDTYINETANPPTFHSGAAKFDETKLRTDLMPVYPLQQLAAVLTHGAKKYTERNWEKGLDWSRLYGAALRHLFAFWSGEDRDPESGLPHLAHAMCCITFLIEYMNTHLELDDRP